MRVVDLSVPIGPHLRRTVASRRSIEYLTTLDRIGVPRCRFVALPLRVTGAGGSPVRAIALVD